MNPVFYNEEAGGKGLPPLSPALPIPAEPDSASLRTVSLDDSEHLLHNHQVSVAALRLLFTFAPECRSASRRNERSPSPEYPLGEAHPLRLARSKRASASPLIQGATPLTSL